MSIATRMPVSVRSSLRGTLLRFAAPALLLAGCATAPEEPEPETPPVTDDVVAFDPANARNVIVDDVGQPIGYFDAKLERRDLQGNLVTTPTAGFTTSLPVIPSAPQRVMLWTNSNYTGQDISFYNSSLTITVNLADNQLNNQVSSAVAPPGCRVDLYDGVNQTGTLLATINAQQADNANYFSFNSSSGNDRTSSLAVRCKSATNTFCGYAYKDANYTGDALPIYQAQRYNLSTFPGWNDTVSSVASNPSSACDGMGLWEHGDAFTSGVTTNQRRLFIPKNVNHANLNAEGMGDLVTDIETDRELSAGEDTNAGLGRLLTEEEKQRGWTKAFVCSTVQQVCVDYKTVITGMTSLAGFYICAKLVGTAAVTAIAAAGTEIASGGAATPAAAALAGYSTSQIIKGAACLAATGAAVILQNSLCSATMETYCNNNVQ